MSAEEIESYKFQLEQVELALESDAENEELKKLQSDLKELINMFEAANAITHEETVNNNKRKTQPAPSSNNNSNTNVTTTALKSHEFSVDQEVMARWSGDGQFYRAIITAIGGADQVFSIKFKGYSESEFVKAEDIKPIVDKKRVGIFENVEGPKKKKKETPVSAKDPSAPVVPKKKKAVEFENKKNAWLNFATGSSSKKKKIVPVINKKSIFKTPDNPEGKVGVVGSGKGMTTYQQRGKHIYSATGSEES
ncbi:hypothetical protein BDF21DRAFT_445282 [Thamnidium elegans]|uniref:Tudor domain-containing protein n=1 Tax=Thamnidium elegans TaxID=101142 RepID=A0A8H7SIA3_9FUNG|nr:hypothetical protein INT48_004218 [Thamnidium elegans]KAI8076261.1 hypothetical protein BDF21DRAFT_445282 [Thamnidium elegans]